MLLLLIAYGRCVADQFGMLHASETSCCQIACENSHCSQADGDHPDGHDSSSDEEEPAPCQLCLIISTDGATFDSSIKVPAPLLLDHISPATHINFFGDILGLSPTGLPVTQPACGHPRSPNVHVSHWLQIATRTIPVRGPSLV